MSSGEEEEKVETDPFSGAAAKTHWVRGLQAALALVLPSSGKEASKLGAWF